MVAVNYIQTILKAKARSAHVSFLYELLKTVQTIAYNYPNIQKMQKSWFLKIYVENSQLG